MQKRQKWTKLLRFNWFYHFLFNICIQHFKLPSFKQLQLKTTLPIYQCRPEEVGSFRGKNFYSKGIEEYLNLLTFYTISILSQNIYSVIGACISYVDWYYTLALTSKVSCKFSKWISFRKKFYTFSYKSYLKDYFSTRENCSNWKKSKMIVCEHFVWALYGISNTH